MAKKFPAKANSTEFGSLRFQTGLSIEELSSHLGFSVRTLYRWERGEQAPRRAALNLLKAMADKKSAASNRDSKFTFIDIFAGIGGLRKGFEPLGGGNASLPASGMNTQNRHILPTLFAIMKSPGILDNIPLFMWPIIPAIIILYLTRPKIKSQFFEK